MTTSRYIFDPELRMGEPFYEYHGKLSDGSHLKNSTSDERVIFTDTGSHWLKGGLGNQWAYFHNEFYSRLWEYFHMQRFDRAKGYVIAFASGHHLTPTLSQVLSVVRDAYQGYCEDMHDPERDIVDTVTEASFTYQDNPDADPIIASDDQIIIVKNPQRMVALIFSWPKGHDLPDNHLVYVRYELIGSFGKLYNRAIAMVWELQVRPKPIVIPVAIKPLPDDLLRGA